jgi:exopolyphosphatase/guanosine-5'-triphosphate,3'-diphosphate pyrophosphatase
LFQQLAGHQPNVFVGVSGAFDTLSEIYCLQSGLAYYPEEPETPLTIESFYGTYALLVSKNRAERMTIAGMIEMRVDMIVSACCLVKLILDKHSFDNIRVSTWSLKEGALMKYIADQ